MTAYDMRIRYWSSDVCSSDLHVGAEVTGEGTEIVIRAQGSRLLLDPELRAALEGSVAISDVTPRAAAAWLAHCLVQEAGGSIKVSEPEEGILLFGAHLPSRRS